jgi:hypothetical protein
MSLRVGSRDLAANSPHPRPLSRCAGEGSVLMSLGEMGRSGRGAGGGWGPLRREREGHVGARPKGA